MLADAFGPDPAWRVGRADPSEAWVEVAFVGGARAGLEAARVGVGGVR